MKSILFTLAASGLVAMGVREAAPKVEYKETLKHIAVVPPRAELGTLINIIPPKYGVNPRLMRAIVRAESGGKLDAIRYEPGQMSVAAKFSSNKSEQMALASSHGPAQIMGWWAPKLGFSWPELYDPETNIETASLILSKCKAQQKTTDKYLVLRGMLTCYNGSPVYADRMLAELGKELVKEHL